MKRLPMLKFLMRKMWNTRLLTLSTFLGLLLAISFTVSVPMYTDGAVKQAAEKTLADDGGNLPAGSLLMRYQAIGSAFTPIASLNDVSKYISTQVPLDIGYPHTEYVNSMTIQGALITPVDPQSDDQSGRRMVLSTLNGLADHTTVTFGRMYSDHVRNGVIEAVVLEDAMFRNNLSVGEVFNYPLPAGSAVKSIKVEIVGALRPNNTTEPYWFQGTESMLGYLMVDSSVFQGELLAKDKVSLRLSLWYYAFDFSNIKASSISGLEKTLNRLDINLDQKLANTKVDDSFLDILGQFRQQIIRLQILLFTLAAPMIAMVFYFIMMNAKQSLDRQRTDIAVIRSRGGSTGQIIRIYLLEGLLLGVIALAVGPLIGWFLAKCIGSANGFLSFVDRKSIPVHFTREAAIYGTLAVFIAIASQVIPAIAYAKSSIVNYKQQLARADKPPLWQRWYLDILLILLAVYGWYLFQQNQLLSLQTGLTSDAMQVNWPLFFVPALTIFSLGLFCLRMFPRILQLINWLGNSMLPMLAYLTITQLSRSAKSYYPLMALLILTLGLGVYSASAARTIDLNTAEKIHYQNGADLVMQPVWEGAMDAMPQNNPSSSGGGQSGQGGQGGPGGQGGQGGQGGGTSQQNIPTTVRYVEPPFDTFSALDGVEAATRVLQTTGNVIVSGKSLGVGDMMGIDNVQFNKVAWFRNNLLPYQPYQYLNLLGTYSQAVIVSSTFADQYQLKPGDLITITLNQQPVEFVIVAAVPYWPAEYPDKRPFFIANLDYIYDQVPLIPYNVWLKTDPNAEVAPMITALASKGVDLVSIDDTRTDIALQNRLPTHSGVFGILSLGFLVSVIISLVGYVLFWYFNLSGRIVQFGVLRAMGLKRKQLTRMLLLEQALTGGLAIAVGIVLGRITSEVFLPFLQTSQNAQTQVPPFQVVFAAKNMLQLYCIVLVMMLMGAGFLFFHVRRLRVHQAIKLGEER